MEMKPICVFVLIAVSHSGAFSLAQSRKAEKDSADLATIRRNAPLRGLYTNISSLEFLRILFESKDHGDLRQLAFQPNGGWVLVRQFSGQWSQVPPDFPQRWEDVARGGREIKEVAFTSTGGWVIIGNARFASNRIPQEMERELQGLYQPGSFPVVHVACAPNGGWVVINGKNGYRYKDIPTDMAAGIKELNRKNQTIRHVNFGPDGAWLIVYERNGYMSNNLPPNMLDALAKLYKDGWFIWNTAMSSHGEWMVHGYSY